MKGLVLSLFAASSFLASAAFGAAITDVTYNGANADAVSGPHAGNDQPADVLALGGSFSNDVSNPWVLLDKSDGPSTAYKGVTFTLTADEAKSGDWTLSWVQTGSPGLPLKMDFILTIKAATSWTAYLFEGIDFGTSPTSGSGTFSVSWLNPGGKVPDLSHASIFGRALASTPEEVPEPATLLLMALALLGVTFGVRRQGASPTAARSRLMASPAAGL